MLLVLLCGTLYLLLLEQSFCGPLFSVYCTKVQILTAEMRVPLCLLLERKFTCFTSTKVQLLTPFLPASSGAKFLWPLGCGAAFTNRSKAASSSTR
jgi:hypothetical protein